MLKKESHSSYTYFTKKKSILSIIHETYVFRKVLMIEQLKKSLRKALHPKRTHCCEALKIMLSNYFCI